MKTQSLSYHGKHFKNHLQKVWMEIGTAICSTAPRGKFLQFSGCFPWLIWIQQVVSGKEQGNQTSASRGFGHALCFGGVYLVWLIDFYLGLFWIFERRFKTGLEAIWGEAQKAALGTHAVPMEIRGSSLEVGLLLWVPLETAPAADYCSSVRLPLPRILDYLRLSEFLSHKVDFISAPKRTTGSLTLHYPVYKRKQEYKAHTIYHPEKYHNFT